MDKELKRILQLSGILSEDKIRRQDPEMDDYYDNDDSNADVVNNKYGKGPYVVGWSAQSHEWYGDEDPSTGNGRYKPKGNGGRVVAINIDSISDAEQIRDELEKQLENENMGEYGKDWYVYSDVHVYIMPVDKYKKVYAYGFDDYFKDLTAKAKDYSK